METYDIIVIAPVLVDRGGKGSEAVGCERRAYRKRKLEGVS